MKSFAINSDGVNLHATRWGNKKNPTVLLVHGYPDSSRVWHKTAALLARDFHVVAYDVRGAGESDVPPAKADYRLEKLTADLGQVIDEISPKRPVHLVAHDWGSIQSWEVVTDPEMSQRIASFTSISGPSLNYAGQWIAQQLKHPTRGLSKVANQVSRSWYIAAFQLPLLGPAIWKVGLDKVWPSLLARTEGTHGAERSPTQRNDGIHGVNLYRANMLSCLMKPTVQKTDIPVQIIVPSRDRFVSPELLSGLQQWAPKLWRIEVDAGHWLPLSHPDILAERVRNFIDYVDSGLEEAAASPLLKRTKVEPTLKRYSGKLVVVTGAGSGIGRETLLGFAEQGAAVIAVDIDEAALNRSVELAALLGAKASGYQLDVGDADGWETFADWVAEHHGVPDVVVNNAGIGMAGGLLDTKTQDWDRLLRINLWSVIHGSALFGRQMIAAAQPCVIVNVASAAAFTPSRTLAAYATSKAAVRMLSDCMRADFADQGIHVVTVCPGVINTGITNRSTFVGLSEAGQARQRSRASGLYASRNLGPKAVADVILNAVSKRRDEVLVGAEAYGLNWLNRFAPGMGRKLAELKLAS